MKNKFKYAFMGLMIGLKQPSILLQLFLGGITIFIFAIIKISCFEWLIVVLTIAMVVLSEWVNSIVEMTVDYISLANTTLAKRIKDLSAGLVLLAAIFAFIIAIIVLYRNLIG